MHAYMHEKENILRRGPGSSACTAGAGRDSAAKGACCMWEFHLLSIRLLKVLNVSFYQPREYDRRYKVSNKELPWRNCSFPFTSLWNSGALEIQMCSHHAKMQWLWHCLSRKNSWHIPWTWKCVFVSDLQYHPYPLKSVLHGLLTVPLPWLHTNHLPDKQQPNLTILAVTWEIKPTRVSVCFIDSWCSDRV